MEELCNYGFIEVFSDDNGIFTLFMTGNELSKHTLKIMDIAIQLTDKKYIHVMKNDNAFLLLILT